MTAERLFDVAEAAEILRVTRRWLADQARAGKVPSGLLGRKRVFTAANLRAIAAAAQVKTVDELEREQRLRSVPKRRAS